jgi:tetratricopeptide (TPR) repeat protein
VFGRGDPRFERQDATQVAEREAGAALTPAQVSRYWTRRALEYIRTEPGDWLRLTGRKVVLASNAAEVADTEDQLSHADWSIPLRVAGHLWHFGILAPLAAAGLWLTWRRRRQLLVLQLMLAAYAASVVLFAVMGRYRYPLVPLLILFAAAAVVELRRMAGSGWERRALGAGVAAAGMLVFCNWPVLSMADMRAVTALNVGTELQARGRLDDAAGQYRQVLALAPDDALAHSNLGTALAALGRPAEAIVHYERALEIAPDDADSHSNLGNALVALDRTDEAVESYRRALALDPGSAEAHAALGMALQAQGRLDDAVTHLRRALDLAPPVAATLNMLGVALASQERLDEAGAEFRRALAIDPDSVEAHANLGTALHIQGDLEQAVAHYREALRIDPGGEGLQDRIDAALAGIEGR